MQKMQEQLKAKNFEAVEKTADSILKLMGVSPEAVVQAAPRPPVQSVSHHPTWSADGKRLAYASSRSGSMEIWVMNADGSGQTQLTHGLGGRFPDANVPCWSRSAQLLHLGRAGAGDDFIDGQKRHYLSDEYRED